VDENNLEVFDPIDDAHHDAYHDNTAHYESCHCINGGTAARACVDNDDALNL
jgi:hypothetical protein